jgi:hypothetical protein
MNSQTRSLGQFVKNLSLILCRVSDVPKSRNKYGNTITLHVFNAVVDQQLTELEIASAIKRHSLCCHVLL